VVCFVLADLPGAQSSAGQNLDRHLNHILALSWPSVPERIRIPKAQASERTSGIGE
jgi:hypothetical protein